MPKETQIIRNLESRIKTLIKENKKFYDERTERGKELEKLRLLLLGWKDQLPEEFFKKAWQVIHSYLLRCTEKNGRKRL